MKSLDCQSDMPLNQPISISDLLHGGANFSLDCDFNESQANELFDDLSFAVESGEEIDENFYATLISPWEKSFDDLKKQMVKINKHLFKRITKNGDLQAEVCPENARVTIQYNGYWEKQNHPFDSTSMCGNFTFYCGRAEVLEGLEAAVRTMREKEEAQFIISHETMYMELGCPPRVKPKADALFIIKLLSFAVVGNENALDEVLHEDRNDFSIVYSKVKEIHLKGLDDFRRKNYGSACRIFHKAATALELCKLKDSEEKDEQKNFLIKLYTNLAVCYNKMSKPLKTVAMCNHIRKLSDINRHCKALFQEGRALIWLGEYLRAKQSLQAAQRLEPRNLEISQELKALAERYETYSKTEKTVWKKAMGLSDNIVEAEKTPSALDEQFRKHLERFKANNSLKTFPLPDGLSSKEIESIKHGCEAIELNLNCSNHFGRKRFFISKRS